VLVCVGFAGGLLIARLISGAPGWLALLAWLAAPVVALAALLLASIDVTLEAERASYNFWFGLVLYGFVILVPWVPAGLAGALIGRVWRGRRARRSAQ